VILRQECVALERVFCSDHPSSDGKSVSGAL
jgi:hypothetical protein